MRLTRLWSKVGEALQYSETMSLGVGEVDLIRNLDLNPRKLEKRLRLGGNRDPPQLSRCKR